MQHTQGKLIVSKGVGLSRPPKAVTYVRKVKKTYPKIKAEWKSIDTNITQVQDAIGAVTLLNGCQQGDDIGNREGRQIQMRSIELKLHTYGTAGTGIDQIHRILLVLDKNPNGVAPAIADIITANTSGLRNLNNRKRFKILMDKRLVINASGEPGTNKVIKKYKQCAYTTQYNAGNAGTIADINNGAIFLVTIGSSIVGATAGTTFGYVRIRFTE